MLLDWFVLVTCCRCCGYLQEARKRLLQSARLRPILFGVNKHGISRVCPKSKEVLEFWEYQVLKNWAYSRRTFVLVSEATFRDVL